MATKNNPGTYDCYDKADPDEPMFILLGRDKCAPDLVDEWARKRAAQIAAGTKPQSDQSMVEEARQCAEAMREFRRKREAG